MRKTFRALLFSVVIALAFGGFSAVQVQAQGQLNTILNKMEEHKNWLQTLTGKIKEARVNSQLNLKTTRAGEIFYANKGGRDIAVRINWDDSNEVLSVINGEYTLYTPGLKQAIRGKTEGSKNPQASNALAFMSMSKKDLKANYEVQYLGVVKLDGTGVWHLKMTPKKKQSYKFAEVWIDQEGMPLQAEITETNGDLMTIRLSSLKKNEIRLHADRFKVDLPKGVKIIKG